MFLEYCIFVVDNKVFFSQIIINIIWNDYVVFF